MASKVFFPLKYVETALNLAEDAGTLIMSHYRSGDAVDIKADRSPVTEADRAADRLIVAGLNTLDSGFPIVSEEGAQPDVGSGCFWLVDPLDGTKSFVRGSGYFTVNIALIGEDNQPALGVIYEPQQRVMYWGYGDTAFRRHPLGAPEAIHCREPAEGGVKAIVSHTHLNHATETFLENYTVLERMPCASSIKFCLIAEGTADLYPRFGPTMEWDTAAGHAILLAAGGVVQNPDGSNFTYRKTGFLNGDFVALAIV